MWSWIGRSRCLVRPSRSGRGCCSWAKEIGRGSILDRGPFVARRPADRPASGREPHLGLRLRRCARPRRLRRSRGPGHPLGTSRARRAGHDDLDVRGPRSGRRGRCGFRRRSLARGPRRRAARFGAGGQRRPARRRHPRRGRHRLAVARGGAINLCGRPDPPDRGHRADLSPVPHHDQPAAGPSASASWPPGWPRRSRY